MVEQGPPEAVILEQREMEATRVLQQQQSEAEKELDEHLRKW